jgi:hypothetical protein
VLRTIVVRHSAHPVVSGSQGYSWT